MSRLHRPKAGFWIRLWVALLYPIDSLLFRIRWRDLDRVPAPDEGGVIIAVNHVSPVDTILMARAVWQSGRVPRFMIKAGVFSWPIVGRMMRGSGQIPVYRGTADATQSLREAVTALERGEAVVIYPEGTTTKDPAGWPMQAKTGIARLVLLAPDIPVVPMGQWGAHQMGGFSLRRLGRRRVSQLSVGQPLDLSRHRGKEGSQTTLREITDEIMSAVRDEVAALRGEPAPSEFFKPTRSYVDKR
ncbi:lysophospholipid acyltransferase family protein [uncultured Jatrophihabitans sp.]|uniref:lysophospholipid acyltransferase family protein n=1 Tax=uncultured Jatrophihabitans sp. TaxID=1610747 RepID=UPI0035CB9AA4